MPEQPYFSDRSSSDKSSSDEERIEEEKLLKTKDDKIPLLAKIELKKENSFQTYKTRWLMLFLFSVNTMMNGTLFMGLSSISGIASKYYHVDDVLVEWLSNMYLIFYVFVALPAAYIMTKWGVRSVLVISSGFQTCAAILHYTGYKPKGFLFVIMGQILAAFAYGMVLQIPGKLSATWFPKNERTTATAIGVFMNTLGVALGFLMPSAIVSDSDDMNIVGNGMKKLFLAQMIMNCVVFLLTVFLFREKPPTPVSLLSNEEEMSFGESLNTLIKDKYFMIMGQAYGIYFGLFVSVLVIISPLVTAAYPDGYNTLIGWMGFTFCMVSIFACFVIGLWLDYYKGFRTVAVFLTLASMLVWITFTLVLKYYHNFNAVFVLFGIHGLVAVPLFACGLEQIAEMTYPVPEGTSGAFALIIGNIYGFVFLTSLGLLISKGYTLLSCIVMAGLYFVAMILSCFAKTELKRCNAEAEEATGHKRIQPDEKWLNIKFNNNAKR